MVKRLGLSAQSVQARFSGSVAGKSGSSSRRRGAEEVEGEEKDDEDEEDGAGEGKDDEGSGEGDDDEDGEGEDEEAVDEGAAATETVRTLVLPLMVIGTVTLMGTTVFTLRLRFTGGARMCWRRVTARQSSRCWSTSCTAAVWSAIACCNCDSREEGSIQGGKEGVDA